MNNTYVYSAFNNAFYFKESKQVFGKEWPDDTVDIDEQLFIEFAGNAPEGKQRIAGDDGFPAWQDIPALSKSDLVAYAEAEKGQKLSLATVTISLWQTELQLGIISDEDKASLIAWLAYIKALKNTDISNPSNINWPLLPNTIL